MRGVAWDERTGRKVRGTRLREDFYTKALTTDPDGAHPQDYVRVPGPDGVSYRRGPKDKVSIPARSVLDDYFSVAKMESVLFPRLALAPNPVFKTRNV